MEQETKKAQYHYAAEDLSQSAVHANSWTAKSSHSADLANNALQVAGDLSIVQATQVATSSPADDPAPGAKNVLMFSLDDMNAFVLMKDLYGSILQTPNLDRLMGMGTTFENAFAQTALCNPSRTSILSGQLPTTTGVVDNVQNWYANVDPSTTLFAAFKNAGYETAGGGKLFHNPGMPDAVVQQMFSDFFTAPATPGLSTKTGTPYTGDPSLMTDTETASWAVNFLNSHGSGTTTQPFMLSVGLESSHIPWSVPPEFYSLYNAKSIPLPPHMTGDLSDVPQFIQDLMTPIVYSTGHWQNLMRDYFAALTYVDAQIGQVLDALDASGQTSNTAIVLWSDHGYQAGDKDNWGKFTLWDTAARAPLIMVDPGVTTPGTTVDHTVSLLDIFPTLLDMAGIPQQAGLQGHSLMPLLQDPTAEWNDAALTFMYGSWSIRTDDYRYIHYEDGSEELYDINADPNEYTNLANSEDYVSIKAALLDQGLGDLSTHGFLQGTDDTAVSMFGTAGNDQMTSPSVDVVLKGGAGDDTYFLWTPTQVVRELADQGNDTVYVNGSYKEPLYVETMREEMFDSTGPAVTLTGNIQDNTIYAGSGAATLLGGDGNDTLIGFWGNDTINGGNGDDVLVGDKGSDFFIGGAGNDSISGGQGIDTVSYAGSPAGINLNLSRDTAQDGYGGIDTIIGVENVIGSQFNDIIVASNFANVITGGNGDDRITAKAGDDTVTGGNGNDRIDGGDGNDNLNGGQGNDRITGGLGQDTIVLGPGHDIVIYTAPAESTGATYDIIQDFNTATDRIQLTEAVVGGDPIVAAGSLTHATFDVDLAALVGPDQLEAAHFVVVTPDSGDLAGHTFLVIDANGQPGYQAGQDYVIDVTGAKGDLTAWTFIAVLPT